VNCNDFERRFQHLLDNRRSPGSDPELIAHGLICQRCQEQLFLQRAVFAQLQADDSILPSPDFVDRVVLAARQVPDQRPVLDQRPVPSSTATADVRGSSARNPGSSAIGRVAGKSRQPTGIAWYPSSARGWGLALALCLVLFALARQFHAGPARHDATRGTPSQARLDLPDTEDLSSQLAGSSVPRLTDRALWDTAVGPETAPYPMSPLGPLASHPATSTYELWLTMLSAQLPDVGPQSLQSVDQIAGGLRPVAVSLGAALETIFRSLPIVDREDRPVKPQASLPNHMLVS
jgi:hypothetical protein